MKNSDTSHRQKKVAILIHGVLAKILRCGKILDARLTNCPVTITRVSVTADLKIAYCYFLPFNTDLSEIDLTEALDGSKYLIRNLVTEEIQLKYSPEIRFYYDKSFDKSAKVEQLLQQIKPLN